MHSHVMKYINSMAKTDKKRENNGGRFVVEIMYNQQTAWATVAIIAIVTQI